MSGMVNPNPIVRQTRGPELPDTMSNRLGQLGKIDADPLKIGDEGQVKSGGFMMTLRSGLHAMFGIGKSEEDIQSNRDTLNNLVSNLRSEAKQMMIEQNKQWKEGDYEKHWHIDPDAFADAVVRQLLKSRTYLDHDPSLFGDPDPKITLQDRIDRGSYVSGKLAGQIKQQFDSIVRGTVDKNSGRMVDLDEKVAMQRAQARRHERNMEIFGGVNRDSVNRFLGHDVENKGILPSLVNVGAGLVDGIKSAWDKLTGTETRPPFERALSQIREQGCKDYPTTDTAFWDTFEDYWTKLANAPDDSPERKEFEFIEGKLKLFANQQAREGNVVDEKALTDYLAKLLTNPLMTSRVQEMRNHNYISQCTPQDIANAIREWRSQQPLEIQQQISQNDCDWLANELEKAQDSERLLLERAPNMLTGFKDWASNFTSFGEKYNKFGSTPLLGRIYETVAKNYEGMKVPGLMSDRQRLEFYKEKYKDDVSPLRSMKEFLRPEAWGPKTLSTLLGDSIKDVLIDRHNRMEQMIPEQQQNRESREILQDNLSLFPSLKAQANRFFEHPEVIKQNPTKPSEFINTIVSNPVVYARTLVEMRNQIRDGLWQSTLPPEPKPPGDGASQDEINKYQQDKSQYERLLGEEHGRFMKEVAFVRDLERNVLDMNINKFQVLDEVQVALTELSSLDMSKLNDEEKAELGRKIDELRAKSSEMFYFALNLMHDDVRDIMITDKEATSILGAVMSAWCDVEAILNDLEAKAGRTQQDMTVLLRDTARPEGTNQTLLDSHDKVMHSLEDALRAVEKGDRKTMGAASDELKRQLVAAFQTALPLFKDYGPDEPQARQMLDLITRAARTVVELDRMPELRGRDDPKVPGWTELVNDLLPSHLDIPSELPGPPSYFSLRTAPPPRQQTETQETQTTTTNRGYNPFDDGDDEVESTVRQPQTPPPPQVTPPPRTETVERVQPRSTNPFDDD